jgi:hypothetical protein
MADHLAVTLATSGRILSGGQRGSSSGSLADIRRNPPRLVFGEQLGRRSPAGILLEIDVGDLLAVAVTDNKAGLQFVD